MSLATPAVLSRLLWRYGYGAKGSLFPLDANGIEVELAVDPVNGKLLTTDNSQPGGMRWTTPPAGGLSYQGLWNASTNSPAIPAAATGNNGWYYLVGTAGTTSIDGISEWAVGDWIISNGTTWQKIDNTDLVTSVAGRTGAVVLAFTDLSGVATVAQIPTVIRDELVQVVIGDGVNLIGTGAQDPLFFLPEGVIQEITVMGGRGTPSGSISIDVWADVQANGDPTVADKISGSTGLVIAAGKSVTETTFSGWTLAAMTIPAGGLWVIHNVASIATFKQATVKYRIRRT